MAAISADGPLAGVDGTYAHWFATHGWSAVAVRPDFYVYGAVGGALEPLALAQDLLRALGGGTAATSSPATADL
ncbi:hypothetical protein [Streptomyces sp. NPDC102409]|uniref:hypothetical protein n=1 Tax=Streptomyces sp. NPDC102409 TaxID=3366172 RepID=UPI00382E983E